MSTTASETLSRPRVFAVRFRQLERWDVKFFSFQLESKCPTARLGPLIQEHNEKVNLFDYPDQTFRILGVNNIGGIFHAYDATGRSINQPYKKVHAGDFAYNPYRVNVGSIGMVPDGLDGNYISPAYVVFAADRTRLIPQLLELILKSKWFNPTLRGATAGSVRQNLTYDLLSSLEIPLPALPVQQAIVAQWDKAQKEIAETRHRVERLRSEIGTGFFRDLGLTPPDETVHVKCFGVWWKDFQRWSVSYNQAARAGADLSQGKYPIVDLGSVLELIQYGTSEKANTKGEGTPILRINNIKDRVIDLTDLKYVRLSAKVRAGLLLKHGDILIIRTSGSRDLVGTCGVFHGVGEWVFASYLIRLRTTPTNADPDFVSWFLNSALGRQQIDATSRQIMQNNINSAEIAGLQIPLPPLAAQREIMRRVEEGRAAIARERERASRLAAAVEQEIEEMILGVRPIPVVDGEPAGKT